MLGALEEFAGFVLQRTAGIEFQVRLDIGDDGGRIVLAFVNAGEQHADVGEGGIPAESVESTLQSFRNLS